MPESDLSEGRSVLEGFDELESAVERLLEEHVRLRDRLGRLEAAQEALEGAVSSVSFEDLGPEAVEARLRELSEENRRLRDVVSEGRERAERIRKRLILMEDER